MQGLQLTQGCPSSLPVPTNVQLQPPKASRGDEWGVALYAGGPLPSRLGNLREHRKLPGWSGASHKRFWGVSCKILCDFTHLCSVFNSCLETGDSYIPLLASRPLQLFLGHPWILGVCGHPRHPQWLRHWINHRFSFSSFYTFCQLNTE